MLYVYKLLVSILLPNVTISQFLKAPFEDTLIKCLPEMRTSLSIVDTQLRSYVKVLCAT